MIGPRSTDEALPESIALTGLPASGKSVVGRALAYLRGLPFVDLDRVIETEAGMRIPAIFAAEGEAGFRSRESAALARLPGPSPIVRALGGGAVTVEANRLRLRACFTTVWLKVEPEIAASRASGGDRPLLAGTDKAARIRELLADREAFYAEVADLRIATDALTAREVSGWIDGKVPRRP